MLYVILGVLLVLLLVAVIRTLEAEFGVGIERAAFVAGHSLGE